MTLRRQHDTIRKIRKKSLTWTKNLSDQLNLAHVARMPDMIKKKLKQTNASGGAHLIQYRFGRNKKTIEERICERD